MYELRDYQIDAVDRGVAFMRNGDTKNGIEILPTGSGKSLVIANIVAKLNEPSIIFQPSKELLEQNYEKFCAYGYKPAIYSASKGRKQVGDITLATIGSVKSNPDLFTTHKNILVDECHLVNAKGGMYKDFFERLGKVKILGLTATPYRLNTDGFGGSQLKFLTRTRPRIFSEVVYYIQNSELFDRGYLAKLQYDKVPGFEPTGLDTNSTGADYTDDSVRRLLRETNFQAKLTEKIQELEASGRRGILVFTRFVEEAEYLVGQIPHSAMVTAETPKKERERILAEFKAGVIRVVCNVGVLTHGFDYPELDTVVLGRHTMSLALYYQMVGRVVRPHPSKAYALVVDMVGVSNQFGRVEDLKIHEDGVKWFIASGDKQLTNVYYDKDTTEDVTRTETTLNLYGVVFGAPTLCDTPLGRKLARTGRPTGQFWDEWAANKAGMKADGIVVTKLENGQWLAYRIQDLRKKSEVQETLI